MQGGPKRVLIVKKPIAAAGTMLLEMADWLLKQGVQVCCIQLQGAATAMHLLYVAGITYFTSSYCVECVGLPLARPATSNTEWCVAVA